jgi:hypothetical protein
MIGGNQMSDMFIPIIGAFILGTIFGYGLFSTKPDPCPNLPGGYNLICTDNENQTTIDCTAYCGHSPLPE